MMNREIKLLAAKYAVVLAVIPVAVFAYQEGPLPRLTSAPGDGLCIQCHIGTANPAGGRVEVTFPGGLVYTPGAKQRLTVTVTDSPARSVNGFQLTARLASNAANGQAGTLTPLDSNTQVICEDGSGKPASGCPSSAPVEFIEHTLNGSRSNTWSVEWTPPAAGTGDVRIYVASNSANGDGRPTGDRIFTANYTLSAAGAVSQRPALRGQQAVLEAFSGAARLASGTWIELYGTNLSSTTREWAGNDFVGNQAPTSLDGVSVAINGKPAFVRYISPTQINVQAPDDDAVGPVSIVVTGPNGASDPITMQKTKVAPALLTTPAFNVGGTQYGAALYPDFQTFVGRANLIAGVPFRPAKPGDTIILFAVGCGPANPAVPAGQFFGDARPLSLPFQVKFGDTVAQAQGFLAANAVGLCQFNITVPNVSDGDVPIDVSIEGTPSGQTLYTTIQR